MKKLLVITLLFLSACVSQKLLVPTQADADVAASKYPGMTLAELNEGKELYVTHCGKCHALKNPGKYTEAEHKQITPKMAVKAKIDKTKEDKILRYLVTLSQRPKQ